MQRLVWITQLGSVESKDHWKPEAKVRRKLGDAAGYTGRGHLQDNTLVLVKASKCVILCYSSNRELTQWFVYKWFETYKALHSNHHGKNGRDDRGRREKFVVQFKNGKILNGVVSWHNLLMSRRHQFRWWCKDEWDAGPGLCGWIHKVGNNFTTV